MRREILSTDKAPAAIGPYAQGVRAGDTVYTSGQIPVDPASGVIEDGGIAPQTRRAISNLIAVLEAAGLGLADVVKTTVFLKDMNDFAAFNAVYAECFPQPYPARSCVEAARLPKDVLVEIEAVAVKG